MARESYNVLCIICDKEIVGPEKEISITKKGINSLLEAASDRNDNVAEKICNLQKMINCLISNFIAAVHTLIKKDD